MAVTGITYNAQHSLDAGNTTPHGMTRVASEAAARRLWIANNSDDQIYKYSDTVAYATRTSLPSGNTQPLGFAYDTQRDEVVSLNQSGHIYRITPSTGASPGTYALNTANTTGEGILYFESIDEYWVVDRSDRLFYRYKASDGSYIGTYALNTANTDARGCCHVGNEAWVLNGSDRKIYRYSSTGADIGTLDLNSANTTPRAMAKVGSKLFVADNGTDTIFDYTLNGSPVIAAISSTLNFVINTAVDFEVRVDLATKVEIEADWEGLYYNWDANNGKLHIEGTPKALATAEAFTIKATAADASTTTKNGTYNVVTPAPLITDVTGTVKFPKGKKPHLFIPVANTPVQANIKGQLIGADHTLEDAGIRIGGDPIPADANFTITSGHFDIEAGNTGGVDTQNDVPFDILTTEPSFTTFTATAGFKNITLTYTKPTDARVMAAKIWKSDEAEPNDDLENWKEVGASPATIFGLEINTAYKIRMRVNQAYIGTKTSVPIGVTPQQNYLTLQNSLADGITIIGDKIIIGRQSGSQIYVDFYNKNTFAYESTKALSGLTGSNLITRLASVGNSLYVFSRRQSGGSTKHYLDEFDENGDNGVERYNWNRNYLLAGISESYLGRPSNLNKFLDLCYWDGSNTDGSHISGLVNYQRNTSNFSAVDIRGLLSLHGDIPGYSSTDYWLLFQVSSGTPYLRMFRRHHSGNNYYSSRVSAGDVNLAEHLSDINDSRLCKGLHYDVVSKTLYFLIHNRLYVIEGLTL